MSRRKNRTTLFIILGALLCGLFAFCYGVAVGALHVPPHDTIEMFYLNHLHDYSAQETLNPVFLQTNVSELITIHTQADVLQRRSSLRKFLFHSDKLPASLPFIERNITDPRVQSLQSVARIDRLTTVMEHNVTSIAYVFTPVQPSGKFMIYAVGHSADFRDDTRTIQDLLDKHYTVASFSMPLTGMNSRPLVFLERFGYLQLTEHDQLPFVQTDTLNPLKYFVQPAIELVNYAEHDYTEISMAGLSGGGFITTLSAAIDPRIQHSYPTAGTLPFYVLSPNGGTWGDYESTHPQLHAIANYPELYILGASGAGRSQTQILNQYDSCCYAGIGYQTYENITGDAVQAIGPGSFSVYLDTSHKDHRLSTAAIADLMVSP